MTAQHTPWHVSGMTNSEEWSIRGAGNHLITRVESQELADLIVRAVNSHALMLEALRDARDLLTSAHDRGYAIHEVEPVFNALSAAIAAATGEDA